MLKIFPSNKRKSLWSRDKMLSGKYSPSRRLQQAKNSHEWVSRIHFFQKCMKKAEKCLSRAARYCHRVDVMFLCCLFRLSFNKNLKQTTIFSVRLRQNSARILIKTNCDCAMSQQFLLFLFF